MAGSTQEIRTIVVDDSPAALRAMSAVVARQPNLALVGEATNGQEALNLARTVRPDLVLVDLEMPVMDGLQATARLHQDCPAARVVVVTVHNTESICRLCLQRGASGFIAKGSFKEELPRVVSELFHCRN